MSASQHEKTVRAFCSAWDDLDVADILGLMSQNAVYHNMPLEPLIGQQQIKAFIEGFFKISNACHFDILNLVANDQYVVTERVDTFRLLNGSSIEKLPVLGIFEFDDEGKISQWREYWDLKAWADRGGPPL